MRARLLLWVAFDELVIELQCRHLFHFIYVFLWFSLPYVHTVRFSSAFFLEFFFWHLSRARYPVVESVGEIYFVNEACFYYDQGHKILWSVKTLYLVYYVTALSRACTHISRRRNIVHHMFTWIFCYVIYKTVYPPTYTRHILIQHYIWCNDEMFRIYTVKPVYNDHLMGYFSAFWSSSRWPKAT